jgi:hypothetical protein
MCSVQIWSDAPPLILIPTQVPQCPDLCPGGLCVPRAVESSDELWGCQPWRGVSSILVIQPIPSAVFYLLLREEAYPQLSLL